MGKVQEMWRPDREAHFAVERPGSATADMRLSISEPARTAVSCIRLLAVADEFVTASRHALPHGVATASKISLANMLDSISHGNAPESCVGNRRATGNQRAGRLQHTPAGRRKPPGCNLKAHRLRARARVTTGIKLWQNQKTNHRNGPHFVWSGLAAPRLSVAAKKTSARCGEAWWKWVIGGCSRMATKSRYASKR